jgi:cobalt/nickel transport system permease protein
MYIVAILFLVWSWNGIKKTMPRSIIPLIALVSSLLFVVQYFLEFPVANGASTWHILGGTMVSMVLGPFASLISMTVTLIIQAMLGDGGLTSFGANIVNMSVIGSLSFFIVKAFVSRTFNFKRLAMGVFAASCISNICTAIAVGLETGISPIVGNLGGPVVTVSTMLIYYTPTGIFEGIVASALIVALAKNKATKLYGLEMCKKMKLKNNNENKIE